MPAPRRNLAVCVHKDVIFAFGGEDRVRCYGTCWAYHPGDNEWTHREPLQRDVSAMTVNFFRGNFWVIGGRDIPHGDAADTPVHKVGLNGRTDEFYQEHGDPLPHRRMGHVTLEFNNQLYVFGGRFRYDQSRSNRADCEVARTVYKTVRQLEDSIENKWVEMTHLRLPPGGFHEHTGQVLEHKEETTLFAALISMQVTMERQTQEWRLRADPFPAFERETMLMTIESLKEYSSKLQDDWEDQEGKLDDAKILQHTTEDELVQARMRETMLRRRYLVEKDVVDILKHRLESSRLVIEDVCLAESEMDLAQMTVVGKTGGGSLRLQLRESTETLRKWHDVLVGSEDTDDPSAWRKDVTNELSQLRKRRMAGEEETQTTSDTSRSPVKYRSVQTSGGPQRAPVWSGDFTEPAENVYETPPSRYRKVPTSGGPQQAPAWNRRPPALFHQASPAWV